MRGPPASNRAVSERMARVARRDTAPELALRRDLHARGLRYNVDRPPVPGLRTRADLVFRSARVAVFVDGCFWHACPDHGTVPRANRLWWEEKLAATVARDRRTDEQLRAEGWESVRVWEHEDSSQAADRIEAIVRASARPRDARNPGRFQRGLR